MATGIPEVGKYPRCRGVDLAPNLVLGSIHVRHERGCRYSLSKLVHSSSNLHAHAMSHVKPERKGQMFGWEAGAGGKGAKSLTTCPVCCSLMP